MSCPFYGKHASLGTTFGSIIPSGGNQCAVIVRALFPCAMELIGRPADAETCFVLACAEELARIYREDAQRMALVQERERL